MITVLGLQVTVWQIIEAIPSIIAAIEAINRVFGEISAQHGQSAISVASVLIGKAALGAVADKAGKPHPSPFTPDEQAWWNRASQMS